MRNLDLVCATEVKPFASFAFERYRPESALRSKKQLLVDGLRAVVGRTELVERYISPFSHRVVVWSES